MTRNALPEPELRVFDSADALAAAAAEYVAERAASVVAARGRFTLALAGGSTPRALYTRLARHPELPWHAIELCFGDERAVPPDHPDSNAGMVRETLTRQPFIPSERVHRMRGELPASEAASAYEQELRALFPGAALPRFDLILLGLGADGHTASLFPDSAALAEERAWVSANAAQGLTTERITLTYPVLNEAAAIAFLVAGADKARALAQILEPDDPSRPLPAARVRPRSGTCVFFVDRPAIAEYAAARTMRGSSGEHE